MAERRDARVWASYLKSADTDWGAVEPAGDSKKTEQRKFGLIKPETKTSEKVETKAEKRDDQ